MKSVIQRVSSASVTVNNKIVGSIQSGLLVLFGVHIDDTEPQLLWMCNKISNLRIFDDENGVMNKSVRDVEGDILIVSQFTLYGSLKKGTRPSYIEAAQPEKAIPMYEKAIEYLKTTTELNIQSGIFGANMQVELVNNGPVTIILEK